MDDQHAAGVEDFRALLVRRHRDTGAVGADDSARAELVFNLTRWHVRLATDFESLHRRRGWTWAGFRIMNVLWAVGRPSCATWRGSPVPPGPPSPAR